MELSNTTQQKMKRMGFFAIYGESVTLAFKLRIIFSQIALTFILPLSLTIFAQSYSYSILGEKIVHLVLLELLSSAVVLSSLVLSTAAVVHVITSFYGASREITYREIVRSVIPKTWKKLSVTLACSVFAAAVQTLFFRLAFLWRHVYNGERITALGVSLAVSYGRAMVNLVAVGQMASVVTVTEGQSVVRAAPATWRLLKKKNEAAEVISAIQIVAVAGVFWWFEREVSDRRREVVMRAAYGGLLSVIMTGVFLMGMVVQTVFYMVCKACRRENIIDASTVLEVVYLGGNGNGNGNEATTV